MVGIVNGTTNYILSRMAQEGMDFTDALAQATELGYAEADPTADVEGYDAGRKVAIMASIAFNSRVTFQDVYTEGITKITQKDISFARELGWDIKLLGLARNTAGRRGSPGASHADFPTVIPWSTVFRFLQCGVCPRGRGGRRDVFTAREPESCLRPALWWEMCLRRPGTL